MASALRLVDAVVEQDKCLATAFEAPRNDVIADDDATILTVEDAIADGEAGWGRGRHLLRVKRLEHRDFPTVYLAVSEDDAVISDRWPMLCVLGGVADANAINMECAVARYATNAIAIKV